MDSDKSRTWPKIIGAILVLVVAIAAYRSMGTEEEPIEYETVKLERKTVEAYVAAIGKIESTTTVTVGSQVSGPVSEVLVDFNSPVEKGQVLARIDPSSSLLKPLGRPTFRPLRPVWPALKPASRGKAPRCGRPRST